MASRSVRFLLFGGIVLAVAVVAFVLYQSNWLTDFSLPEAHDKQGAASASAGVSSSSSKPVTASGLSAEERVVKIGLELAAERRKMDEIRQTLTDEQKKMAGEVAALKRQLEQALDQNPAIKTRNDEIVRLEAERMKVSKEQAKVVDAFRSERKEKAKAYNEDMNAIFKAWNDEHMAALKKFGADRNMKGLTEDQSKQIDTIRQKHMAKVNDVKTRQESLTSASEAMTNNWKKCQSLQVTYNDMGAQQDRLREEIKQERLRLRAEDPKVMDIERQLSALNDRLERSVQSHPAFQAAFARIEKLSAEYNEVAAHAGTTRTRSDGAIDSGSNRAGSGEKGT